MKKVIVLAALFVATVAFASEAAEVVAPVETNTTEAAAPAAE